MTGASQPYAPPLRAFVAESPLNRSHLVAFVAEAARSLPAGSRVLDAGAGAAPYRELFGHVRYRTSDWARSVHSEARTSDIVAPLDELPVEDGAFDAVLATEVLEHVEDPLAVLGELHRVLAEGGRLLLTVPFVWELHEEPHDFFRYTPYGLRALLDRAGFEVLDLRPFGGCFSTLGSVLHNLGSMSGQDVRAPAAGRALLQAVARVGVALGRLDRLDRRRALPLGYGVSALRRPQMRA
jgi:SAM-dependent methyltransferase